MAYGVIISENINVSSIGDGSIGRHRKYRPSAA